MPELRELAATLDPPADYRTHPRFPPRFAGLPYRPDVVLVDDRTLPKRLTLFAGRTAHQSYHQPADVIPSQGTTFRRKSRIGDTLTYPAAPRPS